MASATPVEPAVPSVMRAPGVRRPSRSASSTICSATRSLMLPPGFKNSAFARMVQPVASESERRCTRGVSPMRPRTPSLGGACSLCNSTRDESLAVPHHASREHQDTRTGRRIADPHAVQTGGTWQRRRVRLLTGGRCTSGVWQERALRCRTYRTAAAAAADAVTARKHRRRPSMNAHLPQALAQLTLHLQA